METIRTLRPDEIECRVQTIRPNGCSLLLYKDARTDMKMLDEIYGPENWQRTHEMIGGNLYCNIDIWNPERKEWVRKQDVGVESVMSSEKGQASDAFKRAGFNVGIGRELYTSPFIWIVLNEGETSEKSGKTQLNFKVKFKVSQISYDNNRNITALVITDQTGKPRYTMGAPTAPAKKSPAPKSTPAKKTPPKTGNKKEDQEIANNIERMKKQALEAVARSKDMDSLIEVWNAFDDLWSEQDFVAEMTKKRLEIQKND